ncbi:MAG: hypothetical protein AUJ01_01735 [Acidobacteria bacterium 13_1_40CM_3_65_5]|nr:MAG: hypothetical protein AUH41_11095 [Gemmatimonadetes bacterium 13_1_40CM_66_11]OLD21672.1 MAG: hypothetical protein AUJ01_01735 [Acidobacteria bacterium 13_1_40CM_3_65_5]
MIVSVLLVLVVQTDGWTAAPPQPTVGDTIRVERAVRAPAGWRVRAGTLASGTVAEPLGDAVVFATAAGDWVVRYAVVAWTPGAITLDMPPIWRLGPDGTADSLSGGTAAFHVASVIPDSVKAPAPQPAIGPLRLERISAIPVILAVILAGGALLLFIGWRRRGPRVIAVGPAHAAEGEIPDSRWLSAGEPKAVAARATRRLRRAVAHAIPEAHEALSTAECLTAVERAWPNAPLRDLRELLQALDQVAFATAHGVEVAPLATRARALAREFKG